MKNCPLCNVDLKEEVLKSAVASRCPQCEGLWVESSALERLDLSSLTKKEPGPASECRYCRAPLGFGETCGSCGADIFANCANNHGRMEMMIVSLAGRELELDRCSTSRGVWFDGHESGVFVPPSLSEQRRDAFLAAPRIDGDVKDLSPAAKFAGEFFYQLGVHQDGPLARLGKPEPMQIFVFALFLGLIVFLFYFFFSP